MNRRIAGRVKQARKRAQKRADIRAGRVISMQEYVNRTHAHTHQEPEPVAEMQTGTHTLMQEAKTPLADGSTYERQVASGTESQMRTMRRQHMAADPDTKYVVRKVK